MADKLLPGVPSPEGEIDERWQAITAVEEFIETEPEAVWSFIERWGVNDSEDVRSAISTCLLEHLLEYHFEKYFERVEALAKSNANFADTFSSCCAFGKTKMPENLKRFNKLESDLLGPLEDLTVRWSIPTNRAEIPIALDEIGDTLVILAHGAGSHMEHRTMTWLADLVAGAGASVVRFNFAYRVLGKSMPDRMPVLMETYRTVIEDLIKRLAPKKLIVGGHSMGGRVASMIASEGSGRDGRAEVDGLLLFGYPLHPPGQTEKMRDAHLPDIHCPVLQISGTRDAFCEKELMEKVPVGDNYRIVWIEGADHSYSISRDSGRTKSDAVAAIVETVGDWLGTR